MTDVKPTTFNPMSLPPIRNHTKPCQLQHSVEMLYRFIHEVALSEFEISNNKINGTLFNYGIQEVTIPGLLISYYNSEKKLIYVDHFLFAKVLGATVLNIIY
jgi:hypothetical protein